MVSEGSTRLSVARSLPGQAQLQAWWAEARFGWLTTPQESRWFGAGRPKGELPSAPILDAEWVLGEGASVRLRRLPEGLTAFHQVEQAAVGTPVRWTVERAALVSPADVRAVWRVYWRAETQGEPPLEMLRPWTSRLVGHDRGEG